MLHILAEAHATGMRTYWNVELRRHQNYNEILTHPRQTAAVNLTNINCIRLQQLLEHHAIVAVFSSCNTHLRNLTPDAGMTENVVRAGRLFHPPWIDLR